MDQPPPPPPHGGVPKSSGLPPGKYDIFVIPQHSSGSGFLYLPSLQPNVNSFAAGFACGLIFVVVIQNMAPAFQTWWSSYQGMGSTAMSVLMVGVGIGAWALGRTQQNKQSAPPPRPEHASGPGGSGAGSGPFPGAAGTRPGSASGPPPPPPPHSDPPPRPGPPPRHDPPPHSGPPPRSAADSAPPPRPPSPPPPEPEPEPEPKPEKPKAEKPKAEKPKADKPKADKPKAEKPKAEKPKAEKPKPTWQRQQSGTPKAEAPKGSWEKAREETRRREEERKAREEEQKRQEEEQKRRDEVARKLREQREREARERDQREREARERRERLEAERRERMEFEKREKELREKLERERLEREKLQRDKDERDRVDRLEREKLEKMERERLERLEREKFIKEAREREAREREAREKELEAARKKEEEEANAAKRSGTYAYSSRGEKINPWPNGKPKAPPPPSSTGTGTPPRPAPSTTFTSPNNDQRGPPPSATSFTGTEDDAYSYRPYDKPKQGGRRRNSLSSETSWAPSHTTARTTPPPSMRAPYTTKDPDKIVIKAVYLFLNQFSKTPVSQLVSGFGSVTDGLILRATTEGLFIDDDVRGVPQREWDVKAWTLKQVEVWCPPHCLTPSPHTPGSAAASSVSSSPQKAAKVRDRGAPKLFAGDDADTYLTEMLRACKDCCRMGLCEATFRNTNIPAPAGQTGEWREKGLHLLRATIRDQEAKRYLFVLGEEESWKVPVGLQRLRRGTQARALGVGSMTSMDARGCLELLGWV